MCRTHDSILVNENLNSPNTAGEIPGILVCLSQPGWVLQQNKTWTCKRQEDSETNRQTSYSNNHSTSVVG
jgi:hypothetical protein